MKRSTEKWEPRCSWCHQPDTRQRYVTLNPEIWGSVIRVCGPDCPSRPEGTQVGLHPSLREDRG